MPFELDRPLTKSLEILPCPRLRRYVQLIWIFESNSAECHEQPERIAPDGIVELVLHYGSPMAFRFAGEQFESQPASSLVSQTQRFIEIAPTGATGLISVRFQPWGGYHFFRQPITEFADQCTPAAEFWGSDIAELQDALANAIDTSARIGLVESFLLNRLARHQKHDIEGLLRGLWQSASDLRLREFCQRVGVTERTLERRCKAALGMTPKSYRRLARFLQACAMLRDESVVSLTRVAQYCGYYDQAHFTHDFKKLAGLTPGQFLSSRSLSFLELD